jgi:hypothetical protein
VEGVQDGEEDRVGYPHSILLMLVNTYSEGKKYLIPC